MTLEEVVKRPNYYGFVNEVIAKIPDTRTGPETVNLLDEATRLIGADVAVFTSFIRDDVSHESYRFLIACEPRFCAEYTQRSWFSNDPCLLHAATRSEPCRLSDLKVLSRGQQVLLEKAGEFGFRSGAVFPTPAAGGISRTGVLTLGSKQLGFFEGEGFSSVRLVGRTLAMELHEWWIRHVRMQLLMDARLTNEEIELLMMERQGLKSKEIASHLGVKPASIDSRFQRLIAKLNVANRAAAARLAVDYGLI